MESPRGHDEELPKRAIQCIPWGRWIIGKPEIRLLD
jgi:hypothetical protein